MHQYQASAAEIADAASPGGPQQELRERVAQLAGTLGERMEGRLYQALGEVAERLESAADQIGRFATDDGELDGAVPARALELARSVAETMESTASYLRDSDVQSMRQDLERTVRRRPLQSLLVGVAAGWVAGKILR